MLGVGQHVTFRKNEASADVRVGVAGVVAVDVEEAVVLVLVIVTANVQTRVRSVKVPVIRHLRKPH